MKNKRKNWINITLSILLVLALLSSGFGGYTLAKNLREVPSERINTPEEGDPQNPDDEKKEVVPNTNIPGGEGLKNEMTLKEDVKVFADDAAKTINASITDVEVVSSSFAAGDRLEIKLSKSQEELFGGLRAGDIFVLEGDKNSPLGETYILKATYTAGRTARSCAQASRILTRSLKILH